jgi:preprotein translocase subunit SecA
MPANSCLEYDDVANDQRRVIYQQRTDLMSAEDVAEAVKGIREDVVAQLVDQYVPGGAPEEQWDIRGLTQVHRARLRRLGAARR